MKQIVRITLGLLVVWFGVNAVTRVLGGHDLGPFHQLQNLSFGFLVLFTIAALLLDASFYKLDRKVYQFLTSIVGLTFCGFVVTMLIRRNLIVNSDSVFRVSNLPGAKNVLSFEFKADGKFTMTEYRRLRQTISYGVYGRANDSLFIFYTMENEYDGYLRKLPLKGFIKRDTVYWEGADTMLVSK